MGGVQLGQSPTPFLQRLALLIRKIVTIVHGGNARNDAADVVENLLGHFLTNAELRKVGRRRATKVVITPT